MRLALTCLGIGISVLAGCSPRPECIEGRPYAECPDEGLVEVAPGELRLGFVNCHEAWRVRCDRDGTAEVEFYDPVPDRSSLVWRPMCVDGDVFCPDVTGYECAPLCESVPCDGEWHESARDCEWTY